MSRRHTAADSRRRDAAFAANTEAEQERQAQRQAEQEAFEAQTFTTTFQFADGSSRTQEFRTAEQQQAATDFFEEGRRRGAW